MEKSTRYLKMGYIVSMKKGFNSFIYNEIKELMKRGIDIIIYPTKFGFGPYLPEQNWNVYNYSKIRMVFNIFFF